METGYCMKCKMKRDMKAAKKVVNKGRHAVTGNCKKCNTTMYKFVAKS